MSLTAVCMKEKTRREMHYNKTFQFMGYFKNQFYYKISSKSTLRKCKVQIQKNLKQPFWYKLNYFTLKQQLSLSLGWIRANE